MNANITIMATKITVVQIASAGLLGIARPPLLTEDCGYQVDNVGLLGHAAMAAEQVLACLGIQDAEPP
jgi:hypothetical protein